MNFCLHWKRKIIGAQNHTSRNGIPKTIILYKCDNCNKIFTKLVMGYFVGTILKQIEENNI